MIPHLLMDVPQELERLAGEPRVLLAFDFDGTLSPIAPTPESAHIEPAAAAALERLTAAALDGVTLAVVSGRQLEDLRRLVPRVGYLVGLHGLEIEAPDGHFRVRRKTEGVEEALARVRTALGPAIARGARLEDKGRALALHVRGLGAEDAVAAVTEFVRIVEEEQRRGAPLECLHGKAVVEARPLAAKKHLAIAELLDAIGGAALSFAGDDTTDEEVFHAYPQSLTVAVMERPAVTHARTRLSSPAEVAAMIERFTDLRSGTR